MGQDEQIGSKALFSTLLWLRTRRFLVDNGVCGGVHCFEDSIQVRCVAWTRRSSAKTEKRGAREMMKS